MCWTQKFSFSRDPVILDLKLQLAPKSSLKSHEKLNFMKIFHFKVDLRCLSSEDF